VPVTNVRSHWSGGDLIFHEALSARPLALYNILTIGDDAVTVGSATNDIDLKVFLGATDNYVLFDVGNKHIQFGTNANKFTDDTAGAKFVSMYADCGATSGDARLIYAALFLTGAGGAGEALRGRTVVSAAVAGGVHGGHLGLEIGAGGSITGLGVGGRLTFMIPNSAMSGGTVCGGMSELYAEGASSDISGTTVHSIHRFILGGNETGRATAQNVFEFVDLTTGTNEATKMVISGTAAEAATHGLRVVINGTPYRFLLTTTMT